MRIYSSLISFMDLNRTAFQIQVRCPIIIVVDYKVVHERSLTRRYGPSFYRNLLENSRPFIQPVIHPGPSIYVFILI